jgi:G:T-mismatch repair DNA endonuclease (very short patch repair protein)
MTDGNMKIKVCECGCGKEVREGKRFIHGHNNHETSWNKGVSTSKEVLLKMALSRKPRIGYTHSEATKQKMRENHADFRGRKYTEETKQKMRKPKHSGFGEILSKATQNHSMSSDRKNKISESLQGSVHSEETKQKRAASITALWKTPQFVNKMMKARHIVPNKPETALFDILDRLRPGDWKFTGDLSFIINGKNPDFVNVNGKKKIIELYGDYWHRGEDPQIRINEFASFGWETLVIWERELKDMKTLISKLEAFV